MNNVEIISGLDNQNAQILCQWSNSKGYNFQQQWVGDALKYPLTPLQINNLQNIFSIYFNQEFIGIIQKIKIENNNVHIGRFVINPQKTGLGLGKIALQHFITDIFTSQNIQTISLNVLHSNPIAKSLYQKLGFLIEETIETPQKKYFMKKYR